MSLRIRLSRGGAKKRPFYRIVVADARSPRDGRFIEKIGTYDPMLPKDRVRVNLDAERAKFWLERGAQPSERCARFLAQAELVTWSNPERPTKGKPKAKAQERLETARAAEEEKAKAAAEPPAPAPESENAGEEAKAEA